MFRPAKSAILRADEIYLPRPSFCLDLWSSVLTPWMLYEAYKRSNKTVDFIIDIIENAPDEDDFWN